MQELVQALRKEVMQLRPDTTEEDMAIVWERVSGWVQHRQAWLLQAEAKVASNCVHLRDG